MVTVTEAQNQLAQKWLDYQQNPREFITNCLDVKPEHFWDKMEEIANSVRDNQFTAVPACHSVSKTYLAGRLAVWFKSVYNPSTVVTTAPSSNLVEEQLWREIHAAYSGSKIELGGNMTKLNWDCKPSKSILAELDPTEAALWEKNFATGFSTSPDTVSEHATKVQGFHNKWVLVILDEAGGILRPIWNAVLEGLAVNERCKVLAIGNPTDPTSIFFDICQPGSGWNVINISVTDTPNYQEGREVIPNVAGRDYYDRMLKKLGKESNRFKVRVLGQFPEYREGTFYGRELAKAKQENRIGDYPYDETALVYNFIDLGDMYTAAISTQFIQAGIRLIDTYWDNQGQGLPAYARYVASKPYLWGKEHYCGPDLNTSNKKSVQTGMYTKDIAAQLKINLVPVIPHSFEDGVQAVRTIWPLLKINQNTCDVFLQAAQGYRKKKNEAISTDDQPSYHQTPIPNAWENHMMDALRHLAMAYRYGSFEGEMIGYTGTITETPTTYGSRQRAWNTKGRRRA